MGNPKYLHFQPIKTIFLINNYAFPNDCGFCSSVAFEIIMFGNNEVEDALCAEQVGIKTYLIDSKYLIKDKKVERHYPIISMSSVIDTIKEHLK